MKGYSIRHSLHKYKFQIEGMYTISYYPNRLVNKKEDLFIGCQRINSDRTLITIAEILNYDISGIKKVKPYPYKKQGRYIQYDFYDFTKRDLKGLFKFLCLVKGIEIEN